MSVVEDSIPRGVDPTVVVESGSLVYARSDHAPSIGPAGLAVTARILAAEPGSTGRGPQVALACAQHAAGWSLGLDADGRVSLVVGTAHGPVSARAPGSVAAGEWYEVFARIPGGPGRLEVGVRAPGAEWRIGGVLIGAPIFAARGPLLWGCRALFDGRGPELPFDGLVASPVLVADAGVLDVEAWRLAGRPEALAWDAEVPVGFRP